MEQYGSKVWHPSLDFAQLLPAVPVTTHTNLGGVPDAQMMRREGKEHLFLWF